MLIPNAVEHLKQVVQDIYRHVREIPLQRVEDIEIGVRELEARSLIADGERANLLEQNSLKTQDKLRQWDVGVGTYLNLLQCAFCSRQLDSYAYLFFECLYSSKVWQFVHPLAETLAAYEANRAIELAVVSQIQNGDDKNNENVGEMETKM
nr:hypothetical protein [Tanacetum cinerariifolium]